MLSNLAFAMWMLLLQEGSAGTSWDLRSMWGTMSLVARIVVFLLFGLSVWSLGIMIDRALMYSRSTQAIARVRSAGSGRAARRQTRRSHLHRRTQQEEPHRQGRRHGPFRIPIRLLTGRGRGSDRSRQARTGSLRRDRARRNEARPLAAWQPSARPRRSSDCSARWSASSTRLRASRPPKRPGFGGRRRYFGSAWSPRRSGLLVAVPAVWAYNYFTNKVEAFDVEMDNSSMELINYFITRRAGGKK